MGDLKSRLSNARTKLPALLRRGSATSAKSSTGGSTTGPNEGSTPSSTPLSRSLEASQTLPRLSRKPASIQISEEKGVVVSTQAIGSGEKNAKVSSTTSQKNADQQRSASTAERRTKSLNSGDQRTLGNSILLIESNNDRKDFAQGQEHPAVTVEEPTPDVPENDNSQGQETQQEDETSALPDISSPQRGRPLRGTLRRQSLVTNSNIRAVQTLLDEQPPASVFTTPQQDYFNINGPPTAFTTGMMQRKIWVKRSQTGASATLVQIREDDLVDDVRETILKKYGNSLGRNFDAPDLTLRIVPRDDKQLSAENASKKNGERTLGPEEEMCRTLDTYFPGGQTVNEALLIDIPQRRTPRPSPRIALAQQQMPYYCGTGPDAESAWRPVENGGDYFPPQPVVPSPSLSHPQPQPTLQASNPAHPQLPHAMSVLTTGQVPALPSPGGTRRGQLATRPKYPRHSTASPTASHSHHLPSVSSNSANRPNGRPRHNSSASESKHHRDQSHSGPAPPPMSTPPAPEAPPTNKVSTPPIIGSVVPNRTASPKPGKKRRSHNRGPISRNNSPSHTKNPNNRVATIRTPNSLGLTTSVPPINVLIVEDNVINLRLLEAFMKRLKVRWQTAMNGREAVDKWRKGGFHLVLMDIQLPVMNGLQATKEIRRLERVNGIGVLGGGSSASSTAPALSTKGSSLDEDEEDDVKEEDKLGDGASLLFKSPVIIVALTASSLQSDRHEALAAGCNDFLTKPVNFVWMERKVREWGCMQALIDFDGWRKWKDFAEQSGNDKKPAPKKKPARLSKGKEKSPVGNAEAIKEGAKEAKATDINGIPTTVKAAQRVEGSEESQASTSGSGGTDRRKMSDNTDTGSEETS